jgi:L-iditol 2-dehydrogenase
MRAAVVHGPDDLRIEEVPVRERGEYECLVRRKACGICNATDIEVIENRFMDIPMTYPLIPGHESAGEIVEIGRSVRHLCVGDRVLLAQSMLKPESGFMEAYGQLSEYGAIADVEAMREDGIDAAGKPGSKTTLFPGWMSFEDGAMTVSLLETYSTLCDVGMRNGDRVLVYGDGPNGMQLCAFAKALGAGWVGVAGHHAPRLARIRERVGVDLAINTREEDPAGLLRRRSLDMAIVTIGRADILCSASHLVRHGGKVVLYSGVDPENAKVSLYDFANNVALHKHFYPVRERLKMPEVCALIRGGKITPKDFYSHVLPVEDFPAAVALTRSREAFKVILTL